MLKTPLKSTSRDLDRNALRAALIKARQYTNAWLADLPAHAWDAVPYLPTINPPRWELGHIAWFQEWWCLRQRADTGAAPSLLQHADRWFDSARVAHESRWTLDLPTLAALRDYADRVLAGTLVALDQCADDDSALYVFRLALFHEDMHAEALAYLRQTLAWPGPAADAAPLPPAADVTVAGGEYQLGMPRAARGFVFDNEKWSHPVQVAPFAIAGAPVSETEFAAFVDAGGCADPRWWGEAGNAWRTARNVAHPRYWRRESGAWQCRRFDTWHALSSARPMCHVSAFEAQAWCAWAGRRLPTEAEWEAAALRGAIAPAGVWEWTATTFLPYPGFAPDPYREYSAPWFGTHRVAKGLGRFASPRLWHPRFRNFYLPERADVFVGFRTCACD